MPLRAIDPTRPILSYTLKQRLGAGGYGEVWAAEAPGGLPKAVKFVYGYHDESRAQDELKALNRIRAARHPFLLSLERIDVVDGQLVVITELADMCLMTRFQQCKDSGLPGIPRPELLGYLRDAANALDFISDEFGLQHLDIKPENLLLIGGHVKVADFGLVKDLQEATQSMLSGLTPAYAAPELFDGNPCQASDQYSLGIVFQEMLTGVRPFDGTTTAQLAAQHMHERPNLRPLPRQDQAAISRALSKVPDQRFDSCTELVEALTREATRTSGASPRSRTKLREAQRRRKADLDPEATCPLSGEGLFGARPADIRHLPPLATTAEPAVRPTLLLGVGGTGARVLHQVRRRLQVDFGTREQLPSIRLLCLDTDPDQLGEVCRGFDALLDEEVMAMPLRRPEEYRAQSQGHLSWLSRRWIYNVPKSLRTEGIRPLGRLALATHIDELTVRLRQVMSQLMQPELLGKTANTLGLAPATSPRVILVGSASGGTCGGMGIDLAYIIRAILREQDVANEEVLGVFTHSTRRIQADGDLTIANTLAFLSELYHFSCVEEYPGDDTCDIPAFNDRTTTFASSYLVHLGNDLDDQRYQREVGRLADYLVQSCVTRASSYLDECRHHEQETKGMPLRTLGLASERNPDVDLAEVGTDYLRRCLLRRWTQPNAVSDENVAQAEAWLSELKLDLTSCFPSTHQHVNRVHSDAGIARQIAGQLASPEPELRNAALERYIAANFGRADESAPPKASPLYATFLDVQQQMLQHPPAVIRERLLELIDVPGQRIAGAKQTVRALEQHLIACGQNIGRILKELDSANQMRVALATHDCPTEERLTKFCHEFAVALQHRFTLQCLQQVMASLTGNMSEVMQELAEVEVNLVNTLGPMRQPEEIDLEPVGSPTERFAKERIRHFLSALPSLCDRVEQQLQYDLLESTDGLQAALADDLDRDSLIDCWRQATHDAAVSAMRSASVQQVIEQGEWELSPLAEQLIAEATPELLKCGGAARLVHGYPELSESSAGLVDALAAAAKVEQLTPLAATPFELIVGYEVEQIPLGNVSTHLLKDSPKSLELASRIHTRNDIAWTPISSMQ